MATALLVIDFQRFVDETFHDADAVLARVQALVADARAAGAPVVWVQHSDEGLAYGSPEWELAEGLEPAAGEPRVHKVYRDAFEGTDLDGILRELGATELVMAGAQSDFCVRTAVQSAAGRGYDVVLVGDAHTTCAMEVDGAPAISAAQMVAQTNANLVGIAYPDAVVSIVPAAAVRFAD